MSNNRLNIVSSDIADDLVKQATHAVNKVEGVTDKERIEMVISAPMFAVANVVKHLDDMKAGIRRSMIKSGGVMVIVINSDDSHNDALGSIIEEAFLQASIDEGNEQPDQTKH